MYIKHTHTHTHIYMCVCVCVCFIYIYVCVFIYRYIQIYICIYSYIKTHTYVYNTHTHTYIYIYMCVSGGNEGVLRIPQSSSITETSPSDCLMSYLGHSSGCRVEGLLFDRDTFGVFLQPQPTRLGKFGDNCFILLTDWKNKED